MKILNFIYLSIKTNIYFRKLIECEDVCLSADEYLEWIYGMECCRKKKIPPFKNYAFDLD